MFAILVVALTLTGPVEQAPVVAAAECTPRTGPGIPPPASVPSGIPGLHAQWYGQSGYPTLCPGQTSVATVAYYNSGSEGWVLFGGISGTQYTALSLGTSGPEPGQDRASVLGGNGSYGTPNTRWPDFNRLAIQPAQWVGPNQVAWFQFTVKAPPTPGTYRLYLRPLIEGNRWLEDFGVFWQVTVIPTSTTPQRVTVQSVEKDADLFTAGGTRYLYDPSDDLEYGDATVTLDEFEGFLSVGDVVDVRYETAGTERSTFNIVNDGPGRPPTVAAQIGNFDNGTLNDDIRIDVSPTGPQYAIQRATVPASTTSCVATSGDYRHINPNQFPPEPVDHDVPSGTYCYRSSISGGIGFFGYGAPVTMPSPPAQAAPIPSPRSLDARMQPSAGGQADTFDFLDKLKIAFDKTMSTCGAHTRLRLQDNDGTVAELSSETRNIACDLNTTPESLGSASYPPSTVMTVTLAADPTIVAAGSIAGLQVPAIVVSATDVSDDAGKPWDLASSPDLSFGDPD